MRRQFFFEPIRPAIDKVDRSSPLLHSIIAISSVVEYFSSACNLYGSIETSHQIQRSISSNLAIHRSIPIGHVDRSSRSIDQSRSVTSIDRPDPSINPDRSRRSIVPIHRSIPIGHVDRSSRSIDQSRSVTSIDRPDPSINPDRSRRSIVPIHRSIPIGHVDRSSRSISLTIVSRKRRLML